MDKDMDIDTDTDTNMTLRRACNLTAFIHSSTGPVVHPFASCHEGPGFNPKGGAYVKLSIVSLHWWPRLDWLLWRRLRQASSRTVTRPLYWQCDNPTWSHTALLSRFHARCRSSFRLHNRHSRLLGGALWSQSHCIHTQLHTSTGPVVHPFASRHGGLGFNPQGVLRWNRDSPVSIVSLQHGHRHRLRHGHVDRHRHGHQTWTMKPNVVIPTTANKVLCLFLN